MSDSEGDFVDTQAATQVEPSDDHDELDPLTQSMLEDDNDDAEIDTQAQTQIASPKSKPEETVFIR